MTARIGRWALAVAVILGGTALARGDSKHALAGTWKGALVGEEEKLPAEVKFTSKGEWIYEYADSRGKKSLVVTEKGQKLKTLLPDKTVVNLTVADVSVGKDRFRVTLRLSSFRVAGRITTAEERTIVTEGRLSDGKLAVTMTITREGSVSGVDENGRFQTTIPKETLTLKGTMKKE